MEKKLAGAENYSNIEAVYHSVRETPFELYGFYEPMTEGDFKRFPDHLANVSDGFASKYKSTAGCRVRFSTNSQFIILRAYTSKTERHHLFTPLAAAGFDLYADDPETECSTYYGPFVPRESSPDGYVTRICFPDRRMRYLTIYFPLHSWLSNVELGFEPTATVGEGMKYKNSLPVVFYGSSITQGVSASRSGNTYAGMISRRLNINYLNLGLAGSCRAEEPVIEYLTTVPMSAFVCDYDYNANTCEYLQATHRRLYEAIREKNPTLHYIMLSRPNFSVDPVGNAKRRDIILETFRYARESGDKNVYFIDGEGFFKGDYEDCCTVDAVHPNDLGFRLMAESIGCTLGKLKLK